MTVETIEIVISERGSRTVKRGLDDIAGSATKAEGATKLLGRALGTLAGGSIALFLKGVTDRYTELRNVLAQVVHNQGQLNQVMNLAFGIANKYGIAVDKVGELLDSTADATAELGLSMREQIGLTERLVQLSELAGGSFEKAGGSVQSFLRILTDGNVESRELRAVFRQIPEALDLFASALGTTRQGLVQLIDKGQVTSATFVDLLLNNEKLNESLEAAHARILPTISKAFTTLQNSITKALGEFDQASGASAALSKAILFLADNAETLLRIIGTGALVAAILGVVAAMKALTVVMLTNPFALLVTAAALAISLLITFDDKVLPPIARAIDHMIGFFEGLKRAVQVAFGNIPETIKFALVSALNVTLRAVTASLNVFIDLLNMLPGITLEALTAPELENPAAEQGRLIGEAFQKGFEESLNKGTAQKAVASFLGGGPKAGGVADTSLDTKKAAVPIVTEGDRVLADTLRDLDKQAELLKLNNREREIQNEILQVEKQIKRDLNATERAELETKLRLVQTLQITADVYDEITSKQTQFIEQLNAIKTLEDEGTITRQQANAFLVQSNIELLEGTREFYAAQTQAANEAFTQIDELRNRDLISEQSAAQAKAKIQAELNEKRLSGIRNTFGAIASLSSSENKKIALAGKAAGVVTATIDGIIAVQKALASAPPPANYALAAAVGAATAINIAQIASQPLPGFQTGGNFMVGGQGGPDSQLVQFRATPNERVTVETPAQQRMSQAPTVVQSPPVNVRVINQVDPREAIDAMDSPGGEQVIINTIQRNSSLVGRLLAK